MEGSPFNLFGDPDEFRARMEELSEQMQSSQRVAWADNAIKLAVEMTVASIDRLDLTGSADEQAMQVRDAIRVLFPEAVTLVREAREGSQLEQFEAAARSTAPRPKRPPASSTGSAITSAGIASTMLARASIRRCQRLLRRRGLAAPERGEGDVVAEGDAVQQRLPGRGEARPAAPSGATSRPGRGGRRAAAPTRP